MWPRLDVSWLPGWLAHSQPGSQATCKGVPAMPARGSRMWWPDGAIDLRDPPPPSKRPSVGAIVSAALILTGLGVQAPVLAAERAANPSWLTPDVEWQVDVYREIKQRCMSCHGGSQTQKGGPGATPPPLAAALLGPRELYAASGLVRPGQPDRSPLFWWSASGHGSRPYIGAAAEPASGPLDNAGSSPPVDHAWLGTLRRWIESLAPDPPPEQSQAFTWFDGSPGITIRAGRPEYDLGDRMVFRLQAARHCQLTLINVDTKGIATVIFPNAYARHNHIDTEVAVLLPAPDAPFTFKANRAGTESLIGICSQGAGQVLGIAHDFDIQRFTVLGSWADYLQSGRQPRHVDRRPRRARRWRVVKRCRYIRYSGRLRRQCRFRRVARRAEADSPKPEEPAAARITAVSVLSVQVAPARTPLPP